MFVFFKDIYRFIKVYFFLKWINLDKILVGIERNVFDCVCIF